MFARGGSRVPSADVEPVRSDEVPRQRLPCHVPGHVLDGGVSVHQANLLGVQSVLQVPARQRGALVTWFGFRLLRACPEWKEIFCTGHFTADRMIKGAVSDSNTPLAQLSWYVLMVRQRSVNTVCSLIKSRLLRPVTMQMSTLSDSPFLIQWQGVWRQWSRR